MNRKGVDICRARLGGSLSLGVSGNFFLVSLRLEIPARDFLFRLLGSRRYGEAFGSETKLDLHYSGSSN